MIQTHLATANHIQSLNSILLPLLYSNNGGVLSQHDDSSNTCDSNKVNPDKIIEGGTFNNGSGSSISGDSKRGIDSSKINSSAVFNQ